MRVETLSVPVHRVQQALEGAKNLFFTNCGSRECNTATVMMRRVFYMKGSWHSYSTTISSLLYEHELNITTSTTHPLT